MFQNLQDKLDRAFKVLKGQGTITEINVAETMKEIRKALLDADVNYKTAKTFTDEVKEKALTIPRNYLIDNEFVYLANKEKRKVKVGLMDYEKVEILAGITVKDALVKSIE